VLRSSRESRRGLVGRPYKYHPAQSVVRDSARARGPARGSAGPLEPPPTRAAPARPGHPGCGVAAGGCAALGGRADMIARRRFLLTSLAGALAGPLAAGAQQAAGV